jgi:16S rRNA (cytidine1402-2'-O)-methyltransferase
MSIPGATLFVVATPLGNLDDLSPRAVQVLGAADVLYAEDTRRSRVLLDHFGIGKRLDSLHEHNERERSAEVLAALDRGERVAILTDAGTPAVSDPGSVVVARAAAAGFRVSPVPGPSALTAALSVAGFDAGPRAFCSSASFRPGVGSGSRRSPGPSPIEAWSCSSRPPTGLRRPSESSRPWRPSGPRAPGGS